MKRICLIVFSVIMVFATLNVNAEAMTEDEFLSAVQNGDAIELQKALLECADDFDTAIAKNSASSGGSSVGGSGSSSGGSGGGGGSTYRPSVPVSCKTYSFAGTVSLPNNEVAKQDIMVNISICETEAAETVLLSTATSGSASSGSSGGGGSSSGAISGGSSGSVAADPIVNVIIPAGKNSVQYSTEWCIPETYSYAYAVAKNKDDDIYLQYAKSDVMLLDETAENILNIELNKPECYISGNFTLGEKAETLPDDLDIRLSLYDIKDNVEKYSYTITLEHGETNVGFSLPAIYGKYNLSYYVMAYSSTQQHIVLHNNYASIINAEADVNDIVLECRYNDVIEGVVKLPDGMVAPKGGIDINIRAGRTVVVTIPEGENSAKYIVEEAENIYFQQENIRANGLHTKSVNLTKDEAGVVELEPIYTVSGFVTFNEPVEDDERIQITVYCPKKGYSRNCNIDYETGKLTAEYCIELPTYNSQVEFGDVLDISIKRYDSEIYLSYDESDENAITVSDYVSTYDFNINLKKRVEIIKGVINIPKNTNCNNIYVCAKSENNYLSDRIYISENTDGVGFSLKGDSDLVADYNGSYDLYLECGDYSEYRLMYNDGSLSLYDSTKIEVKGKTLALELAIPDANQRFMGNAVLPQACTSDINVTVNVIEKTTGDYVGGREVFIGAGKTSVPFELNYLLKNAEYIVSYSMSGSDIFPYYDNLELFIGENGYTDSIVAAKSFVIDEQNSELYLDFEPFICSSCIKGTISLPYGIVPASNTYFYVDLTASNGSRKEQIDVRFDAGETEKNYSISIPNLYKDSLWKLSYKIDTETKIPSAPIKEVINDSSFRRISGGSTSSGGTGYNRSHNVVPSQIIKGVNAYYNSSGIKYGEDLATDISLNTTDTYIADFVLGTTYTEHPRVIGGYFCDVDSDISVKIELCDIVSDSVLDSVLLASDSEYEFYSLNTNTINDVVIRYTYDNKTEYYSTDGILTDSLENAMVISVNSNPVNYGYDVNKNNVKYKDFNDRYFSYRIKDSKYPYEDIRVQLYDTKGNILESINGRSGYMDMNTALVYIGYEFGGKTYYFTGDPYNSRSESTLSCVVENISLAYLYRIPHKSYSVDVILDMSDFVSGRFLSKDGDIIINETYFNCSIADDGIYVSDMYIDINDAVFQNNGTVYVGIYDKTGRLLGLRAITSHPQSNTISVDEILPDSGYIKVMPWGRNITPLSNATRFFN